MYRFDRRRRGLGAPQCLGPGQNAICFFYLRLIFQKFRHRQLRFLGQIIRITADNNIFQA